MRKLMILLACTVVGVCVASCGGGGDKAPKRTTIAVIPKGQTQEFSKSIHAGAVKAARELDVDIIWKGPVKDDDREAQIAVMKNMIAFGVTGIVLAPLDDTALSAPVADATRAGIPVVIIDSGLESTDYISFASTDNYQGGKMAGARLAELIGGKGEVIMLRYQEGSAGTMRREQGFLDAIAQHPRITVVRENLYGGATSDSAQKASEDLLGPLRNDQGGLTIDGIFCPNESTTFGMLLALQDNGLAGKVRFVGFDSSPKFVEALGKGEINALTLQNPMKMGYLGVKTIVKHLRGEKVEKRIDTGVTLATTENMNQPEVKELLSPDFNKWLKDD